MRFIKKLSRTLASSLAIAYAILHIVMGSPQPSSASADPCIAQPPIYPPAAGADASIAIWEILPNPHEPDGMEWIELHNTGQTSLHIGDWILDDIDGGSKPHRIPKGTIIHAGAYLVLHKSVTGIALNNDTDEVRLIRTDGIVHDAVSYTATQAQKGKAYARIHTEWQWTEYPTPGSENTPQPIPQTGEEEPTTDEEQYIIQPPASIDVIRINEFMPDPDGDDMQEWIELINIGDTDGVLDGWTLDDSDKGSKPFTLSGILEAGEMLVIPRVQSGINLNNTHDEVRLFNPNGEAVHIVAYEKPKTGMAYAWTDTEWAWTSEPTPGEANQFPIPEIEYENNEEQKENHAIHADIADIASFPIGERLTVSGIVSLEPGIVSKTVFTITNTGNLAGASMRIYGTVPEGITQHRQITVTGTVAEAGGMPRLHTTPKDIVLGTVQSEQAVEYDIADIDQGAHGIPVQTEGILTAIRKQTLTIANNTGDATIKTIAHGSIEAYALEEGMRIRVHGIAYTDSNGTVVHLQEPDTINIIPTATTEGTENTENTTQTENEPSADDTTGEHWAAIGIISAGITAVITKKHLTKKPKGRPRGRPKTCDN